MLGSDRRCINYYEYFEYVLVLIDRATETKTSHVPTPPTAPPLPLHPSPWHWQSQHLSHPEQQPYHCQCHDKETGAPTTSTERVVSELIARISLNHVSRHKWFQYDAFLGDFVFSCSLLSLPGMNPDWGYWRVLLSSVSVAELFSSLLSLPGIDSDCAAWRGLSISASMGELVSSVLFPVSWLCVWEARAITIKLRKDISAPWVLQISSGMVNPSRGWNEQPRSYHQECNSWPCLGRSGH